MAKGIRWFFRGLGGEFKMLWKRHKQKAYLRELSTANRPSKEAMEHTGPVLWAYRENKRVAYDIAKALHSMEIEMQKAFGAEWVKAEPERKKQLVEELLRGEWPPTLRIEDAKKKKRG